eukprot:TRINITY_DN2775_c0_g3_i1.p1 TRINITY_DN2775_c0_g3~~TRINITY_DN2775_c0_g3_i1.p1  ORF type:complete len:753 (+),score=93.23 TRINITY_DN2775_c0_g3_i1:531-2789(+)
MAGEDRRPCFLESLPLPLQSHISHWLEPKDLARFSLCSSSLYALSLDHLIWHQHLIAVWGEESTSHDRILAEFQSRMMNLEGEDDKKRLQKMMATCFEWVEGPLLPSIQGPSLKPTTCKQVSDGMDDMQRGVQTETLSRDFNYQSENVWPQTLGIRKGMVSEAGQRHKKQQQDFREGQEMVERAILYREVFAARSRTLLKLQTGALRWPAYASVQLAVESAWAELRPLLEDCLCLLLLPAELPARCHVASVLLSHGDVLRDCTRLNRALVQAISDLANRSSGARWRSRGFVNFRNSQSLSPPLGSTVDPLECCLLLYGLTCRLLALLLRFCPFTCIDRLKRPVNGHDLEQPSEQHESPSAPSHPLAEDANAQTQDFPVTFSPHSLAEQLLSDLRSLHSSGYGRPDIDESLRLEAANALGGLFMLPALAAHEEHNTLLATLTLATATQGVQGLPGRPAPLPLDYRGAQWPNPDEEKHRRWIWDVQTGIWQTKARGHDARMIRKGELGNERAESKGSRKDAMGKRAASGPSDTAVKGGRDGRASRSGISNSGSSSNNSCEEGGPMKFTYLKALVESPDSLSVSVAPSYDASTVDATRERILGKWQGYYSYGNQGLDMALDPAMCLTFSDCIPLKTCKEQAKKATRPEGETGDILETVVGYELKGRGYDGVGTFVIEGKAMMRESLTQAATCKSPCDAPVTVRCTKIYGGFSWEYKGLMDGAGMYGQYGQGGDVGGFWALWPVSKFTGEANRLED